MGLFAKATSVTACAVLTVAALLLPSAAHAAPILAEDTDATPGSACVITGGDLTWGVKESFRSYISGTIANGEWQVADGASYETPAFSWSNPTGEIDGNTGAGSASFKGSVLFTGHDGVLNLHIENPTIAFKGDGTASLLLDTKSNNAQGELVVDEQQVFVGKIEGIGSVAPASGGIAFADAPTVLTAEGALAFSGFYSSGDELDPITLSLQFAPCTGSKEVAEDQQEDETVIAPDAEQASAGVPWLPIGIGAVALVTIGVTLGMLIAGRKKL